MRAALFATAFALALAPPVWGQAAPDTPGPIAAFLTPTSPAAEVLSGLSPQDLTLYAAAFAAAARKDWTAMDGALSQVGDGLLRGRLLSLRYLDPAGAPSSDALAAWLALYGDHPAADDIYAIALRQRAADQPMPPAPAPVRGRAGPRTPERPAIEPDVGERLALAQENFYANRAQAALSQAQALTATTAAPQAHWIAGLSHMRLGDAAGARMHFAAVAQNPHVSADQRAAGAYWAARAHLAVGDGPRAIAFLQQAAETPLSFYGLIAERQLGRDPSFRPAPIDTSRQTLDPFLMREPGARRAAALAALGRRRDADAELRLLHRRLDPADDPALLGLAGALDLAETAVRIGEFGDTRVAAGLYPVPGAQPADGWRVDRAILFAIMRQESRYQPHARSRSNARGLMQLLPSTAAWIAKDPSLERAPDQLYDPSLNLSVGQLYVEYLFSRSIPSGRLDEVLAGYNGGPNFLQRWLSSVGGISDPLMMIEAIPRAETRDYVEKVMANVWLYQIAFGQATPTLDALAEGRAPIHQPQDRRDAPRLISRLERASIQAR